MIKKIFILLPLFVLFFMLSFAQNVGIGTQTPNANALLHVDLGLSTSKGLLFTGTYNAASSIPNLGAGSRLMFFPGKSAFRAGAVDGTQWDNGNVGVLSTAFGFNNIASGLTSFATGHSSVASNTYAFASGFNNTASGTASFAGGYSSLASGQNAIAIGFTSSATGPHAVTLGVFNESGGIASFAVNSSNSALGDVASALGYNSVAKGYAAIVVGMYNDSILTANQTASTSATPLFIVGNGIDDNNRSNAMVVRKDGNTGIGVSDPSFRLDIANRIRLRGGGTNATSPGIWLNNINNSGQVGFMGVYDDTYMGWYGNGGAAWTLMMNVANGNIGIGNQNPSFKLDISDRMRIRSGAGANTAGLYFNKADNSNVQAFMGMKDDNYVGLFGVPQNNWGFLMNTVNGNIGINTASPQALLHIVRGAKTNGPVIPTAAAIIEGNLGGWIQLSNNNNIEGGILSGNQQTEIRSGIVFGTDSSVQLRSGGNFTNLNLDKNGNANFNADINVDINAKISGEVRRPSTGTANLVPICYGSINSSGGILSGTGNFSVEWTAATGQYRITITGENYTQNGYCTFITPQSATLKTYNTRGDQGTGYIFINIFDNNTSTPTAFHFMVFKP